MSPMSSFGSVMPGRLHRCVYQSFARQRFHSWACLIADHSVDDLAHEFGTQTWNATDLRRINQTWPSYSSACIAPSGCASPAHGLDGFPGVDSLGHSASSDASSTNGQREISLCSILLCAQAFTA